MDDKVKAIAVTCILAFGAVLVWAEDTLVRDGVECVVPDGYNSAPHHRTYNARGMGDFCEFPAKQFGDAFKAYIQDLKEQADGMCPMPDPLPECGGLVVGPGYVAYPCIDYGP